MKGSIMAIREPVLDSNEKKIKGVFTRLNSNEEKIIYIIYKSKLGKTIEEKIGILKKANSKSGVTITYAINQRADRITRITRGELLPKEEVAKEKIDIAKAKHNTLCAIAKIHFNDKSSNRNITKDIRKYEIHIESVLGANTSISDIDDTYVDKVISVASKLSKKTISGIVSLLSSILTTAVDKDYILVNPIVKYKKKAKFKKEYANVDNASERYLSSDEIKSLLKSVTVNNELYYFVHIAIKTGGRANALLQIRKRDIRDGNVYITDEKSDERYKVPLSSKLSAILKERLDSIEANDYIIGGKSTPYSYNTLNDQIRRHFAKLFNVGLDFKQDRKIWVSSHTLRHTFASHLAINGTPIYTIKNLMNHKEIEMTLRYAKLSPDNGKDEIERLM